MQEQVHVDVSTLYAATGAAKLADLGIYLDRANELAGEGNEAVLTGQGPSGFTSRSPMLRTARREN